MASLPLHWALLRLFGLATKARMAVQQINAVGLKNQEELACMQCSSGTFSITPVYKMLEIILYGKILYYITLHAML